MATIVAPVVSSNNAFTPFPGGTYGVIYSKIDLPATLALNDVIQAIPVVAGQTVHDVKIKATDLDSNGTPTIVLDVGDGTTADYFINGSTAGQTGGNDETDANVAPLPYTVDDTIDVLVQVGPATGAAGSIEVWAYVS